MEDASNQGSSANGTAALNTLLIPDIPESTTPDNIVCKFNDNGDNAPKWSSKSWLYHH